MPYAHKYANAVTEHGMIEALRMFLPQEGAVAAMLKGGVALASKDIEAIMQLLIDAEMKMFHGLNTPVVFMQNVITDLLLGLRMNECFRIFHDHVRARYGAEPGFITMNVPRLLDVLDALGIDNPIVCANINKIGFRMCGGIELYEEAIAHAALPAGRDVGARLGRDRAARGDRVRLRAAEDRGDRVRRVGPRQHPADEGADRRAGGTRGGPQRKGARRRGAPNDPEGGGRGAGEGSALRGTRGDGRHQRCSRSPRRKVLTSSTPR